ncbi:hypothetical protein HOS58_gp48 [Streptomyces phage Attoomi]|uniref:DUF2637 domain-containing protein n=1 Tax=Streptomyces phage Attoomi TaxID=2059881 RepID=A0A2H5BLH2_9CAUD|nr:hypothetical protein HOS58_gp48 [Streptomyces phage Attoomi]AUG87180.1 hypothetical protein SEA_ATTOOMI_48 [Streptomyces phage Attoomi]
MSTHALPWYARPAAFTVLGAALVMSAPGEYSLAVLAGWSPWVAWLMPVCVSVYAAVAAMFVDSRPKGAPGRGTAILGAAGALALALAAQVTAHLIAAGYAQSSAWLVAAVSAVPPVVVAHIMHMVARAHGAAQAAQEDAVEEPEATADSTPEPEAVEELVDVEPVHDGSRPAELTVITGGAGESDALPLEELEPVAKTPAKGGRSLEEIRAAVAKLEADGQPVNGNTYAALVGVSARTARRDLAALAA